MNNKAKDELEEPQRIILSDVDWKLLNDTLTNPPMPNVILKAAFERYKKKQFKNDPKVNT